MSTIQGMVTANLASNAANMRRYEQNARQAMQNAVAQPGTGHSSLDVYNEGKNATWQDKLAAKTSIPDYLSAAQSAQEANNQFNADQAKLQRDWQESMSATAHQREVADLKAAGLNPVISAFGSGASVGSGAAASSDNQLTSVFGSMAQQALSAVSALSQSYLNATTSKVIADNQNTTARYTANLSAAVQTYAAKLASETNTSIAQATNTMNYKIAQLQALNSQTVAKIAGEYNLSSAQVSAAAANYSADLAYASSVYGADRSAAVQEIVARMNNDTSLKNTSTSTKTSLTNTLISSAGPVGSLVGAAGLAIGNVLGTVMEPDKAF